MPHLPHTRNLREMVHADLLRAQRIILRIQDEIDPQFRIASAEGDWWIAMTLVVDPQRRAHQMRMVSRFMQWKLTPAFTMASEIIAPDAVHCIGVSHRECHAAMSRIKRDPIRFGRIEWLQRSQIDDAYVSLLPRGKFALDAPAIAELEEWFGEDGKFPAMRISDIDGR